jgi:[ribosomal protein S5]-alanine N-acetyltransferase
MRWPELIDTERLVLRPPARGDADAVFDGYARDREVVRYLTWRPHRTIADTHEFLDRLRGGWVAGTDLTWALTLRGDDRLIGMIGLRPRGFKSDIGYVLAAPYWGRGLMAEAGRAIVDLAFADPAVHRVWAVCDVDNRASARVLEKVGMTLEGVLRRWIVHPNLGDEPRDSLCYSRIRQ